MAYDQQLADAQAEIARLRAALAACQHQANEIDDKNCQLEAALAAAQAATPDQLEIDIQLLADNFKRGEQRGWARAIEAAAQYASRYAHNCYVNDFEKTVGQGIRALRPPASATPAGAPDINPIAWGIATACYEMVAGIRKQEGAEADVHFEGWLAHEIDQALKAAPAGAPSEDRFTIILERREDGGLRVCSDDVPGLILSGPDPNKIMADVWPALLALLQGNMSALLTLPEAAAELHLKPRWLAEWLRANPVDLTCK